MATKDKKADTPAEATGTTEATIKKVSINKMLIEIKQDLDAGKTLTMGELVAKYGRPLEAIQAKLDEFLDEKYTYGNMEAITIYKEVIATPEAAEETPAT